MSLDPSVKRLVVTATVLLAALAPWIARAQDDVPGAFDFYVFALSWSPTYCETEGWEDNEQCDDEQRGFVVHGLWPQRERGYPEFCESPMSSRVSRRAADSIADIMPDLGLLHYEWRKHGLCTGLTQDVYFRLIRQAFERVVIPSDFADPIEDISLSPFAIEEAFLAANPGMPARGVVVTCRRRQLVDVRVCLTKDLEFRECDEVDDDACRSRRIELPADDD